MMFDTKPWQWYVERADHFRAIEQKEISLFRPAAPPWEFVTSYRKGGLHRLNVSVSGEFRAFHPSGIAFTWHVDIEVSGANGTGILSPDLTALAEICSRVKPDVAASLRAHLAEVSAALRAEGARLMSISQKCFGEAIALERLGVAA